MVTGSGTGVGKTITAAALAACALASGRTAALVKPVQTGLEPGEPGDIDEVRRLTGLSDLHEYVRYAEALAPATAARRLGRPGPAIAELADEICSLDDRDLVIVEGAGGALVRLNAGHHTLLDLAAELTRRLAPGNSGAEHTVEILLTASCELGTLHATAATTRVIQQHGLAVGYLVITDWPAGPPTLVQRCNLGDLQDYSGAPLHGVIAERAGQLDQEQFRRRAVRSLTPALGGSLDAAGLSRLADDPVPADDLR